MSNQFKFSQWNGWIWVACLPLTPLFFPSPTLCSVLIMPTPSSTSCLTIPPSCASSAVTSLSCSTAQIRCAGGDVATDTWASSRQNTSSLFSTASDPPHLSNQQREELHCRATPAPPALLPLQRREIKDKYKDWWTYQPGLNAQVRRALNIRAAGWEDSRFSLL